MTWLATMLAWRCFSKRLFTSRELAPHEFGPWLNLSVKYTLFANRCVAAVIFDALKLLCADAVLVSHLVPILIVDLE